MYHVLAQDITKPECRLNRLTLFIRRPTSKVEPDFLLVRPLTVLYDLLEGMVDAFVADLHRTNRIRTELDVCSNLPEGVGLFLKRAVNAAAFDERDGEGDAGDATADSGNFKALPCRHYVLRNV
jgi:hypothetical protein